MNNNKRKASPERGSVTPPHKKKALQQGGELWRGLAEGPAVGYMKRQNKQLARPPSIRQAKGGERERESRWRFHGVCFLEEGWLPPLAAVTRIKAASVVLAGIPDAQQKAGGAERGGRRTQAAG